jgi:small nuclear ribonucleoprotein (snRNP)-like protein
MLLFWGANPTKQDSDGRTPLDVAIESASTAAEGEIEMLRQKFLEFGGVLPEVDEDMNVKMEEVEETRPVSDNVDRENTANEYSTGTVPSPTLDNRIAPINEVDEKSPEPPIVNGDHEETAGDQTEIQQSGPVIGDNNEDPEEETKRDHMQIDEPETELHRHSPEDLPEPHSEPEPTEEIPESQQEKVPEVQPMVTETVTDKMLEKTAQKETTPAEPSPPSDPLPQPRWMELSALESLPESIVKELPSLVPMYSMFSIQLQGETEVYFAHIQVCCILGFTTEAFFTKCLSLSL